MTFIAKPRLHHPTLHTNKVGYTRRDYEGRISTLCAGCGHDSISAAIIQACWDLDIEPHRVAKLSGIGCSSKTPDYFLGASHGFNTVHGRMPSVLTGANMANRQLLYLGVSGDGDSASIGLGQFANAMRRGVRMAYIVENNGVYGLTKGQFSATADRGSKSKKGVVNSESPVDLVGIALQLGATYVARSFSGDKAQLVPLIKGAMAHGGAAFIDVISPCVTFNMRQCQLRCLVQLVQVITKHSRQRLEIQVSTKLLLRHRQFCSIVVAVFCQIIRQDRLATLQCRVKRGLRIGQRGFQPLHTDVVLCSCIEC